MNIILILSYMISKKSIGNYWVPITTCECLHNNRLSREPYIGARFCAVRLTTTLCRIVSSVRLISQAKTVTIGESVSKRLLYCPPFSWETQFVFDCGMTFRICTAFQYSSLANHARISTVENRKLRMTIASRQSTNFLMQRLSCNQSLALAERSTSRAFQDYL
jgi:hypothetical protein